jgi:hypothetical protein
MHHPTTTLLFESVECSVRPVYLPIGRLDERICIALVGVSPTKGTWARATAPKPLAGLPNDLGHAVAAFGGLVVADYQEWCDRGHAPESWLPPIGGLTVGDFVLVEGFDIDDALRVACSLAGLVPSQDTAAASP